MSDIPRMQVFRAANPDGTVCINVMLNKEMLQIVTTQLQRMTDDPTSHRLQLSWVEAEGKQSAVVLALLAPAALSSETSGTVIKPPPDVN